MTSPSPNIPLHYLAQVALQLERYGCDAKTWLATANLSVQDIQSDSATLDFDTFCHLVQRALRLSGEPNLGLQLGHSLPISAHGALGLALMSCGSLRQGLDCLTRFMATRSPLFSAHYRIQQQRVVVEIVATVELGNIETNLFEIAGVSTMRQIRLMLERQPGDNTTRNDMILGWALPYAPPDYAGCYRDFVSCPVTFGADAMSIAIDASVLDVPLQGGDPHSFAQALGFCEQDLSQFQLSQSLMHRVRQLIAADPNRYKDLNVVADTLCLTPRTLHRRLRSEGTQFSEILEGVRKRKAKRRLLEGRESIQQLAYDLGYAETANFRRAFKRWYGVSPHQFRQQESHLHRV